MWGPKKGGRGSVGFLSATCPGLSGLRLFPRRRFCPPLGCLFPKRASDQAERERRTLFLSPSTPAFVTENGAALWEERPESRAWQRAGECREASQPLLPPACPSRLVPPPRRSVRAGLCPAGASANPASAPSPSAVAPGLPTRCQSALPAPETQPSSQLEPGSRWTPCLTRPSASAPGNSCRHSL